MVVCDVCRSEYGKDLKKVDLKLFFQDDNSEAMNPVRWWEEGEPSIYNVETAGVVCARCREQLIQILRFGLRNLIQDHNAFKRMVAEERRYS